MLIDAHALFAASRHHHRTDDGRLTTIRDSWRKLRQALHALDGDQGVEAIHDARTHARRLRSILKVMRKEVNPSTYETMRFDLKNIGRELAGVRTADAHLRCLRELSSATRHLNTKDMLTMISLCERRAAAARKLLTAITKESVWTKRIAELDRSIGDDELLLRPRRTARDECRALLASELRAAARLLRKRKNEMSVVHKQRIRLKNTRYVCEQLQTAADIDLHSAIKRIDRAQSDVGDAHDFQSLSAWLNNTPVPQALYRPLLKCIERRQRKLIERYHRQQAALRRCLRDSGKRALTA